MAKKKDPTLGETLRGVLDGMNRCLPRNREDDRSCDGCLYETGCMENGTWICTRMYEDARAVLEAVKIRHMRIAGMLAKYCWPPNLDSGQAFNEEKAKGAWMEVLEGEF